MTRRILVLPALLLLMPLSACGEETDPATPDSGGTAESRSDECEYVVTGPGVKKNDPTLTDNDAPESMVISTNRGDLTVTLKTDTAPCASKSFASLARQGYFDDTECHRLTTSGIYVLQCGDPTGTGTGGPGYTFADELSGDETYPAGTLAMANAGPDTNGSQFFVVYDDTGLPPSYTVFGTVDETGLAAVRKVAEAGTDDANGPGDGHPTQKVVIESVR